MDIEYQNALMVKPSLDKIHGNCLFDSLASPIGGREPFGNLNSFWRLDKTVIDINYVLNVSHQFNATPQGKAGFQKKT